MAGINFVRRWVMGQMKKTSDDGIMITLPDKNKVDLNVNITMDKLLRNGIDPNQITSPQQVDNAINMINSRMVERAIPANSAEGREITEKLFGKQKAPVFDLEGNRIPEGSGIMGGKSVKELMDSGQVTKGARGMKKSKKVQDREMFQAANERLTSDIDTIVKNIKRLSPMDAMKEANLVIGRKGYYKNLTPEQSKKILQDTEDHIFERDIPEEDFAKGGRAGFAEGDNVNTKLSYRPEDFNEKLGIFADGTKISGGPMSKTPTKDITSTSPIEKNPTLSAKFAGSIFDFNNTEDEEETESKADGGRAGFGGGGTMGASDKGYQGGGRDKKGNVSGTAPGAAAVGGGPEDKGSPTQNLTQYLVNQGVSPKEIRVITGVDKPSVIDKIKDSPYNNPFTRGILKAGAYTLNPTIAGIDFRKAMQIKDLYDYTTQQINNPVSEEDLTLGLITDQQKSIIDKQGNIGKLTGAFDPNQTFNAAKKFDDEGSSGILGIGGRDAEPMTREEFDNYVKEKGYATGGRAGFMAGGMGRRGFLKMLAGLGGGIAAAKTGLLKFAGKEPAKQVAKEVVQKSGSTPPPYFFKLAEKIKMLGDDATATTDRTIAKTLKSKDGKSTYLLEEDVTSGDTIIKKINKEGDEMITDVEIMELRKGEVVKGKDGKAMKTPDEYDEVTEANARIEGDTFNDPYYSDGIEIDDILREVDDIPVPKASGGIARMLGE